jgi:RNA polymerase-binding protein DksA
MMASKKEKSTVRVSPYSDKELEYFREIILQKRENAEQELAALQGSLRDNNQDNSSDGSAYSSHMADAGTDAQEREKKYMLHTRTPKFIRELDAALERIDNKTYGVCKVTGKKISKGRLESVPHTQISIEAKLKNQR